MQRAAGAATLALVLASCAPAAPAVTVHLSLEAPSRPDVEAPIRNALGIVDLESWPLFVALHVHGPGMEEPLLAEWPESPQDWQDGMAEIEFSLDVPAGKSRILSTAAFRRVADKSYCYLPVPPETVLDLDSDSPANLDLVLAETAYGSAAVSLPAGIAELWLVDATDLVLLDRRPPVEDFVKFTRVPVARPMRLAVVDGDGNATLPDLEPFTLDQAKPEMSLDVSDAALLTNR